MSRTIVVKTPLNTYDISIESNWLDLDSIIGGRKCLIVTDETVYTHYESLLSSRDCVILPSGEETKSFKYYLRLIDALQERRFNRSSLLIAFGGGVIGDLTGFVASTYMRGISLVQIPTTLLSMVDSSVGGKVAINHPNAKNLIGSFYQPEAVYVDLAFLKTLEPKVLSDGMAEVIKYGLGFDSKLFSILEKLSLETLLLPENEQTLTDIVARCCELKAQIVGEDERDTAERQLLNLGHTVGHAIEQHYLYKRYTHGAAVAIGMNVKSQLAKYQGRLTEEEYRRIDNLLLQFELPHNIEVTEDWPEILKAVHLDKKSTLDAINWVQVDSVGHCSLKEITFEELIKSVMEIVTL